MLGGRRGLCDRTHVAENGQGHCTQSLEHDDNREVDLERVGVVVVEVAIEPADEEVIEGGEHPDL